MYAVVRQLCTQWGNKYVQSGATTMYAVVRQLCSQWCDNYVHNGATTMYDVVRQLYAVVQQQRMYTQLLLSLRLYTYCSEFILKKFVEVTDFPLNISDHLSNLLSEFRTNL